MSESSRRSLREIGRWNVERYGYRRAENYLRFIESRIEKLANPDFVGRPVPGRSHLKYLSIQKRPYAHGHIAVYREEDRTVLIVDIFHTAQDWQNMLDDET